jgi:hypothetical protein
MHSRLHRTILPTLVFAAALLAPSLSPAQTAQVCLASQERAVGNHCKGVSKCYTNAMKKGAALDPACLTRKAGALSFHLAEAEALSNCLVEGAATTVAARVEADMNAVALALTLEGGRCAASKMTALGKECAAFFRCNAIADGSSSTVDPSRLAVHAARLAAAFAKAERKGGCVTSGDGAALEDRVALLVEGTHDLLRGTGTTTTTTTTTSTSTSTVTLP